MAYDMISTINRRSVTKFLKNYIPFGSIIIRYFPFTIGFWYRIPIRCPKHNISYNNIASGRVIKVLHSVPRHHL